ncbi:MAG TPA: hypothetical protein VFY99_09435 [Solirubrobacterales bacterium]
MADLFATRPAWYVLGPLIGLVVLGLAALVGQRIGALGGYSEIVERSTGRISGLGWKFWFLAGIFGGALAFRLVADPRVVADGYGWLSAAFSEDAVVALALVGGGVLIGYGAKTAGGCTSGNGLGGCSAGSSASFAATATFMGTAIAVSLLTEALFG